MSKPKYRRASNGRFVKFDSDKKNDFQDGRNSTTRYFMPKLKAALKAAHESKISMVTYVLSAGIIIGGLLVLLFQKLWR